MLDTHYEPKKVEEGKYESWKDKGYFSCGDKSKQPFSLVIPPPNVTGKLHLGHVMDTIPDDIIARYKRMMGFDVLWVPGVDHAGIATQAKVEAKLRESGISRFDLGREKFVETTYKWKDEYAATIHKQWAKIGLSVDYNHERFTLDEGISKAVRHVFVSLYNEGLIYQGERIINWDPELHTALSNIEVIHQDDEGEFYYFYYDVVDSTEKLVVATTRPETMFGDQAIFVNPKDERYKHLIGKKCINPANGEELPIMGDSYVDLSFGTGAMKATPAHDPNDYKLAKKYNLKIVKVLDESARMNANALKYAGLDRYECRKALVNDIKENGHLQKIEKFVHSVGHSERSGVVVEPMLSKQWFVKMKPLADKVIEMMNSKDKINFIPKRFEKVLTRWMSNCDDWCVSRQLWWGHRIPAYYSKKDGSILVSETEPDMNEYVQDEDVLDTWFSSGLWPFATLGWPEKTDDFERYFPTSVLVTGYDIIFFWVSRMVFQSLHFTNQIPFKDVVIHGLIRDELGRKMSKSLGNGIDPIDVIDQYGVDALRYFITTNSTPGQDMRYSDEKLKSSQNYLNKIWNATRYVEMNLGEEFIPSKIDKKSLSTLDRYILSRLNKTIKNVQSKMEKYEFGAASSILYSFVYDDFCSFYLEMSKITLLDDKEKENTKNVLYEVIRSIILMIYPYTPFIAEEMYLSLPNHKASIMEESYPKFDKGYISPTFEKKGELLKKMISDIRGYKSASKIAPNAKMDIYISPKSPFKGIENYLERFTFASKVEFVSTLDASLPSFAYGDYNLALEQSLDKEELIAILNKEIAFLEKEVSRGENMLSNPNFVAKAPKEKINLEKEKLETNKKKLTANKSRLESLK